MGKKSLSLLLFAAILSATGLQSACAQGSKKAVLSKSSASADELDNRINLVAHRIAFGDEPKLTQDFLLAGVTLDPQFARRFTEFSGDQCGRYLSAFSRITVPGNPVNLQELARKIAATQKPDGRFGNAQLDFSDPLKLEGAHMALLWGNGRLLTGLMDYYAVSHDRLALEAAKKLGNFLVRVAQSCLQKEVAEKFKTKGAMGYICFTQITDGLVKLYQQTSDKSYLDHAASIYPLLPPLGNQHSHGYLNTLYGVMGLYAVTREPSHLSYVEEAYKKVVEAPDFLVSGGVPEFFGNTASKEVSRDEGCSEADFVMLSLELWKATGKMAYLERAEFCLLNELLYNQFESGDFGSHPINRNLGFDLASSQGRCWWCCDYHGLQAMLEAKKVAVTASSGRKQVNLYAGSRFKDAEMAFTLAKEGKSLPAYTLRIDSCGKTPVTIALRSPVWADKVVLSLNGRTVVPAKEGDYLLLKENWKKGDQIKIGFAYRLQLSTGDRRTFSQSGMPARLNHAALQYGPYLLGVDDLTGLAFLAEPSRGNVIYLPAGLTAAAQNAPATSNLADGYLELGYKHEGYYAPGRVTLRPISEMTHGHQGFVQLWFNFEKR